MTLNVIFKLEHVYSGFTVKKLHYYNCTCTHSSAVEASGGFNICYLQNQLTQHDYSTIQMTNLYIRVKRTLSFDL